MAKKSRKIQFEIDEKFVIEAEKHFKKYGFTVEQGLKLYLAGFESKKDDESHAENQVNENAVPYTADEEVETLTFEEEKEVHEGILDYIEGRYMVFDGNTPEKLQKFLDEI